MLLNQSDRYVVLVGSRDQVSQLKPDRSAAGDDQRLVNLGGRTIGPGSSRCCARRSGDRQQFGDRASGAACGRPTLAIYSAVISLRNGPRGENVRAVNGGGVVFALRLRNWSYVPYHMYEADRARERLSHASPCSRAEPSKRGRCKGRALIDLDTAITAVRSTRPAHHIRWA